MARISKKKTVEILDLLREAYPEAGCALEHVNVYELIVCVVLSAQTTDASVNKVSPALFAAYPDAFALADASQEDVMDIIRTIGMYKTKSKNIIALARALCEKYDGQVPEDYDALVALPGVGRKTANVVLAVGFGQQRIAVDTHVFRVSHRIGLASDASVGLAAGAGGKGGAAALSCFCSRTCSLLDDSLSDDACDFEVDLLVFQIGQDVSVLAALAGNDIGQFQLVQLEHDV